MGDTGSNRRQNRFHRKSRRMFSFDSQRGKFRRSLDKRDFKFHGPLPGYETTNKLCQITDYAKH